MREHNAATFLLVGGLGLAEMIAAIVFGFSNPLIGLLFAFVLPGFAIASAVFSMRTMPVAERILLSVGLSVTADILSGLLINLLPGGLSTEAWGAMLGGITASAALVALVRWRDDWAQGLWPGTQAARGDKATSYFSSMLARGMMLVSVVIVAGAFAVAIYSANHAPSAGFTQLWMLSQAKSSAVEVGVRNEEQSPKRYTVQLFAAGSPLYTWKSISLAPGQSWTVTAPLPAQVVNSSARVPVQAILYLSSAPSQPYRETLVWVGSAG